MRILAIADVESKALWDYYEPERVKGLDLIISCGDLAPEYLEFLVTMANCPLLYVHGNHDNRYINNPPLGCICIEDTVYDFQGLRILGLGGSMRYNRSTFMYTEKEMRRRIRHVNTEIRLKGGIDLVVTHAPCRGYGDLDDLPHRGFECFNDLLETYKPAYMIHGHVHKEYGHYGQFEVCREHSSGTQIINAYDNMVLNIEDHEYPPRQKDTLLYKLYMWKKSFAKKWDSDFDGISDFDSVSDARTFFTSGYLK